MKKLLNIFAVITLFITVTSCNEIIEPDLSKKKVGLISPQDNYQTGTVTNRFDWTKVEGASQYRLQIAQPSFFGIQQLIADTLLDNNSFICTLIPGTYQWRVLPLNESSEGTYTTRIITILSSSDLNAQTLLLNLPLANYLTKQTTITFKWDTLYNADEYRLQIINSSMINVVDVTLTTDSATYTLSEGQYTWQVRAQNSSSNTQYFSRSLTIDLTPPPVSISLMNPTDSIFSPDTLFWSRNTATVIDSIYIYPDSLVSSPIYKGSIINSYYIFTGTIYQDYFWRLKSSDVADNWSNYSPLQKIWIKP